MVKKVILCIIILLFTMVTLVQSDLGTYQQNKCLDVKGKINDSSANVTIYYPNSSIAVNNQLMSQITGEIFNYTFCYTTTTGIYIYDYCDSNGENCVENSFMITPTGDRLDQAQGIMYIFVLISMIGIFIFTVWGSIKLPFRNERNSDYEVIKIEWKKYLKLFSISIAYVTLIWIIFLGWNLSWGYLQMEGIGIFFKYLFYLFFALSFPIFVGIILFGLVAYLNDKKVQKFYDNFQEVFR